MEALKGLYAKLRLRVNESKSAVARVQDRKFLGYSFWIAKGNEVKIRVAPKALEKMKERVRQITRRSGGRSLKMVISDLRQYLPGWKEYFPQRQKSVGFAISALPMQPSALVTERQTESRLQAPNCG